VGQADTALRAAAGQDLTAVGIGHSLAEAVHLGALTLLGLIGTEHCMTPPLQINPAQAKNASALTRRRTDGNVPPAVDNSGAALEQRIFYYTVFLFFCQQKISEKRGGISGVFGRRTAFFGKKEQLRARSLFTLLPSAENQSYY